jgi:5,10-methylenetetrahydromethanopterin reductase
MSGGPRAAMARAVAAEEAGFDQIWTGNDFLGRSGLIGLAAAATATSRIHLGVGVVDPVTLHPGQIAAIASEMQALSDGRAPVARPAHPRGRRRDPGAPERRFSR